MRYKRSITGISSKHLKMSPNLAVIVLGNEEISRLPFSKFFIKSCIFSWFKNSILHFSPCRNFLLSSWEVNFLEILFDSLYHDFGPNWMCPYLWALAEWSDARFDLALTLFFSFLNTASLLRISFLRFLSVSLLSSFWLSLSLEAISTLPRSTPALCTRARNFVVYSPWAGVGAGSSPLCRDGLPGTLFSFALTSTIWSSIGFFDWGGDFSRDFFDWLLVLRLTLAFIWRVPDRRLFVLWLSHRVTIWHIWDTEAVGTMFRTVAGEPSFIVDKSHNFSDDISPLKMSTIFVGGI